MSTVRDLQQTSAATQLPIFVSIIPNLLGGAGHVYAYHCAVREAIVLLHWSHWAAVAPDSVLQDLPEGWTPALDCPNLETETNPLRKALNWWGIYRWSQQVAAYLRQVSMLDRPVVVFLERFIPSQLIGLWLALWQIPTDRLAVWLLYRRDIHLMRIRPVYKLLNTMIQQRLLPHRLQLLTDSEPKARSLSRYFCQPVAVVPIPHTVITAQVPFAREPSEILCWWAGEPRPEKGLAVIQQLVALREPVARQFRLILAASAEVLPSSSGMQIQTIADNLSRQDYERWLVTSDVILLPYDRNAYQERTSGIFVEAVIAGKLPIVTSNTWMAQELAQYGLQQLAVDWEQPGILSHIAHQLHSPDTLRRMQKMQQSYLQFHNPESYGSVMQHIYWRSFHPMAKNS